jgi:cystathionine beta-lyase
MFDSFELFGMGYSWGGYESLIVPVQLQKLRTSTTWKHEGSLVRIHVGLENVDDIIADLEAGFAKISA